MQRILTAQRQADIYAKGALVILGLGTVSLLLAALAAVWAAFELAQVLLGAIIESSHAIIALYGSADPFTRFLIIAAIAWCAYKAGRAAWRALK